MGLWGSVFVEILVNLINSLLLLLTKIASHVFDFLRLPLFSSLLSPVSSTLRIDLSIDFLTISLSNDRVSSMLLFSIGSSALLVWCRVSARLFKSSFSSFSSLASRLFDRAAAAFLASPTCRKYSKKFAGSTLKKKSFRREFRYCPRLRLLKASTENESSANELEDASSARFRPLKSFEQGNFLRQPLPVLSLPPPIIANSSWRKSFESSE